MKSEDIRILLLSRYSRNGASTRIRYLQYIPYLHKRGFQVDFSPLLPASYVQAIYTGGSKFNLEVVICYLKRIKRLLNVARYDVIWLENETFPWFPAWFEALFGSHGVPYVVDYDDATFHRYDLHKTLFVREMLGKKIDKVMYRSACVVAGNKYITERACHASAQRIATIPSVVDLIKYPNCPNDPMGKTGKSLTIGWIGTPVTARYVKSVLPVFQELLAKQKIGLILIGSGTQVVESKNVIVREWTEDSEIEEINRFDVGIMPLHNTPWELGKCGYKLIQYMACGKPVIASPVGVNKEIVRHGWNGYLADSDEEWRWAINSLMTNPQMAREMGANGRKLVEEKYSVQSNVDKLAEIFRAVAKK